MLENKVFGLISLGCDKNRVDAERLLGIIREKGYRVTDDIAEANILIVNTCAFLASAREEAIDTVLECDSYRGKNLEKIVVSGCLPEKFIGELFPSLTEGDVFLGCSDADVLMEAIERSYAEGRVNAVGGGHEVEEHRVLTTPLHYAYLKIADGCNNFCTYCLIPKIRGKYRSYPIEALVAEASHLGELSELILVAQDVTRYGIDLYGEKKLVELIRRLSALDNIGGIRLLYCYPDVLDDALIDELAHNDKLIKYVDIPLQHSEDRILKLMNRKYTREQYIALVNRIREACPDISLSTDILIGFPGETESDLEETLSLMETVKFEYAYMYHYNPREGTKAFELPNRIPEPEKIRRLDKVIKLQHKITAELQKTRLNTEVPVLVESVSRDNPRELLGRTGRDSRVVFKGPKDLIGDFVNVRLEEIKGFTYRGTLMEN